MADHYEVLGVSPSATDLEIKEAYRHLSLETHPDRFPVGSPEQKGTIARFQEVNDAYFVLSDPGRRRDYDSEESSGTGGGGNGGGCGFGSLFNNMFPQSSETKANAQFGTVFEEMMVDEGLKESHHGKFYGLIGGAAGAVLGFIIANIPGAFTGAIAGYTLGNIRDATGKAVYQVFQDLPHAERTKLISVMLGKVMGQVS